MRRALFILLPLFLVGCQGGEPAKSPEPAVVVKPPVPSVRPPYSTDSPPEFDLVHNGRSVTVGMQREEAFKPFAAIKEAGLESEQLPPGFVDPYLCQWYEKAQEGFGVITYQGKVAAAMYQVDHSTVDSATQMVDFYTQRFHKEGARAESHGASYWFWERNHQRFMICALPTRSEGVSITFCVGDSFTMDGLNASPEHAGIQVSEDGAPSSTETPTTASPSP